MTLFHPNNNTTTDYADIMNASYSYRRYVLGVTTFTPKFFSLIRDIEAQYKDNGMIAEAARELEGNCQKYNMFCLRVVEPDIGIKQHQIASRLYALIDDIDLSSSIQDKLGIWHLVSALSEAQLLGPASFILTLEDHLVIPDDLDEQTTNSSADYPDILSDYAELLQAWLDDYFEEYDEYANDDIMMDIVSIIVDLEGLTKVLADKA